MRPTMSTYERLRATTDAVASAERVSEATAALWVMTVEVLQMASLVPFELRPALVGAGQRWYLQSPDGPKLEPWRVASWQFLEAKHGNSTTVIDRVDVAVRGLICVLWDEEPTGDEVDSTLEYLGSVMDAVPDDGSAG